MLPVAAVELEPLKETVSGAWPLLPEVLITAFSVVVLLGADTTTVVLVRLVNPAWSVTVSVVV